MRVLIAAAGQGIRLRPLTKTIPKCLVDINGRPLISYLLSSLKLLDVSEVVIVTGFMGERIKDYVLDKPEFPKTVCIYNERYESTNSIVSLSLTRQYWDEDFCIIDSDLLLRFELIELLVNSKDTCLIVDNSKPYEEIDMKVKVDNGRFIYMDKSLPRSDAFGDFFGLSRWTPALAKEFNRSMERYLSNGETNVWYEWPIREMAADNYLPVKTCSSDMWVEIDNMDDYSKALKFKAS